MAISSDGSRAARRTMRDLVALSALPAVWDRFGRFAQRSSARLSAFWDRFGRFAQRSTARLSALWGAATCPGGRGQRVQRAALGATARAPRPPGAIGEQRPGGAMPGG